jgi:hypothetical protein
MRTLAASLAIVLALEGAPLQCSRSPDPELRREDSAGDALWDLAQDFDKRGNHTAARDTLRFLVERYPSNRHAPAAREQLAESAPNDGG